MQADVDAVARVPGIPAAALWRDLDAASLRTGTVRGERLRTRRDEALALARKDAIALAREGALAQPRVAFRIVALDRVPDASGALWAEGRCLHAPRLLPETGRRTALACAVATIGDALEARVRALFAARRVSLALALDAVGNELLLALTRRLQDRIVVRAASRGCNVAGELRAGDPGLALKAQPDVLALAGATAIGVTLTPTLAMTPAKSTALVQGVGEALPAARWSRCDDCRSRARCRLAAQAAHAVQAG